MKRKISASGLFSIDKTILVSILSASVTYLIILVQFQMTFDSKTSKAIVPKESFWFLNLKDIFCKQIASKSICLFIASILCIVYVVVGKLLLTLMERHEEIIFKPLQLRINMIITWLLFRFLHLFALLFLFLMLLRLNLQFM